MRIAVINETSTKERNEDIISALVGFGHTIINAGMKKPYTGHELTYIETGLLGAILLNLGKVDFVIGGCGTGQGFLNSIMQYPGIFCGLIRDPLDAWLFNKINGGNCVSLALNMGYGWGGEINLKFIFEKLFGDKPGEGYPVHRRESQKQSREKLKFISRSTHLTFEEILERLDEELIIRVLSFPGIFELVNEDDGIDPAQRRLKEILIKRYKKN